MVGDVTCPDMMTLVPETLHETPPSTPSPTCVYPRSR
jgi:hypothetical protein